MKAMMQALIFLAAASAGVAQEDGKTRKTKDWDPTHTDYKDVVEWHAKEFKGFGSTRVSGRDGLKAMGSPKTQSPELATHMGDSRRWDADASRLPWLKKDFQVREARIVPEAKLDWESRRVETDMARGFDKDYPTYDSPLDKEKVNREFTGEFRDSRKFYTGPEAEKIREDLKKAGSDLDLGEIVDQHQLSVEKIKEMLNKP